MLDVVSCWHFDWATAGTWVGGIGSAWAAIAAITIARKGDQAREVEKKNALEIYKILVGQEIIKFAIALPGIRSYLVKEIEGHNLLWANILSFPMYSDLLDGVPEMKKNAEMLRLLPLQDGKDFAMIAMLCSDLSRKLNQSLEREKFIEPPISVIGRIDILTKHLGPLCSQQEVDLSALGDEIKRAA